MGDLIKQLEETFNIQWDESLHADHFFTVESYRKKDYAIAENTYSNSFYLVLEGYLRSFHISNEGEEITTEIYRKGDLVASMYSMLTKEKTFESIQCISDAVVCKIEEQAFEKLCAQNRQWFQVGLKFLKNDILKKEERIRGFAKLNASERYLKLLNEKPDIVQNVPVHYLASYLGIKPESLSRLRGQKVLF